VRAVALCAVTLAGCGAACWTPTDDTPGWKRVELPADAPSLAAPSNVEQLRPDAPALVWSAPRSDVPSVPSGPGSASLSIAVPDDGAQAMELELAQSIDGARVEIDGERVRADPLPLVRRRVTGNTLHVDWDDPEIERLRVTIHHHLRPAPVVRQARTAQRLTLSERHAAPLGFRRRGSLYYLQPEGRPLLLCNAPARTPSVNAASLAGEPRDTTLRRLPLGWAQSLRD